MTPVDTKPKRRGRVKTVTTKHAGMVETVPVLFDALVNPEPAAKFKVVARYEVRRALLYTMLDYINENNQTASMQDVWRRMCYGRSWTSGQVLRRVYQEAKGVPKEFMWDWPISLFLHYMHGFRLRRTTGSYRISSRDEEFRKWLLSPIQERLDAQRRVETDRVRINDLDFRWRCHQLKLDPRWVKRNHAELLEAVGLAKDELYINGALAWLQQIEKG